MKREGWLGDEGVVLGVNRLLSTPNTPIEVPISILVYAGKHHACIMDEENKKKMIEQTGRE